MRFQIRLLLILVSATSALGASPSSTSITNQPSNISSFDADEYNRLNDKDRVDFILAMMDRRLWDLRICPSNWQERRVNVSKATQTRYPLFTKSWELRRLDGSLWMRNAYSSPSGGQIDTSISFDGNILTSLSLPQRTGISPFGRIEKGEGKRFTTFLFYHEILKATRGGWYGRWKRREQNAA